MHFARQAGYIEPSFVPNRFDVNAASLKVIEFQYLWPLFLFWKDIGDFDKAKYRTVKVTEWSFLITSFYFNFAAWWTFQVQNKRFRGFKNFVFVTLFFVSMSP